MSSLLIIILVVAALLVAGAAYFFLRQQNVAVKAPEQPAVPKAKPKDVAKTQTLDSVDTDVVDEDLVEVEEPDDIEIIEEELEEEEEAEKATFRDRLGKAREGLAGALGGLRGRSIDEDAWEDLEEALILADVGVPTTMAMLERVRDRSKKEKVKDFDGALGLLREEMEIELGDADIELALEGSPAIWLFVGVNGVGKTTTIGKLAKRETDNGRKLVLAAGDTFRAAAAEQLETWANRSETGFVRGAEGADPGSVVFDAVEHAAAADADLVLADTAGRLHNKANLMEELRKVRRVAEKAQGKVSEVLLVIDATTGQNGLVQAKQFTEAVEVTGIVLTKLDGSAKGGIVLAIQSELGIPVKLVGLGEGIDDLVAFDPHEFVDALVRVIRPQRNNNMAESNDWLGGFTLEELLGSTPVTKTKKQLKKESGKRGVVSATVGAPFRLISALVKLPVTIATKLAGGVVGAIVEVVKLPVRLVSAIASPWRKAK